MINYALIRLIIIFESNYTDLQSDQPTKGLREAGCTIILCWSSDASALYWAISPRELAPALRSLIAQEPPVLFFHFWNSIAHSAALRRGAPHYDAVAL